MHPSARFWNRMAERYSRAAISDMPAYLLTLEKTRNALSKDHRVLELGCGTASTALDLAPSVREIVASDVSDKMIEIGAGKAQAKGIENIRLVAGDVRDPALGDEPYDAVLAFNLLHLVADLPGELAAIHARVKPGGLFISKTICLGDEAVPLKVKLMLFALPIARAIGLAPDVRFFSVAEYDTMVRAAGFEILEAGNYPASPPRRYLIAKRI